MKVTNTNTHIAVLGAGNIGSAIARGLVKAGVVPAWYITLTRRKAEQLETFRKEGFSAGIDNREALENAGLIVIAVTPQQLNGLLSEIRDAVDPQRHTIISVVSGSNNCGNPGTAWQRRSCHPGYAQYCDRHPGVDDLSLDR